MTPFLDEDVVQRVNDLGPTTWFGTTYRFTSRGRDPRSGAGARLNGGRWNPRGAFAAVYLAQPLHACLAEFVRQCDITGLPAAARISQGVEFHTVIATGLSVLDLRMTASLDQVGLSVDDIADDDWTACQAVGQAAYFLGHDGLIAPSATGQGLVIAVFESRLAHGQLTVDDSHELTQDELPTS